MNTLYYNICNVPQVTGYILCVCVCVCKGPPYGGYCGTHTHTNPRHIRYVELCFNNRTNKNCKLRKLNILLFGVEHFNPHVESMLFSPVH